MNAYRCDGCKKHFDGESNYNIETHILTIADPPDGWHACSWECVATIAARKSENRVDNCIHEGMWQVETYPPHLENCL